MAVSLDQDSHHNTFHVSTADDPLTPLEVTYGNVLSHRRGMTGRSKLFSAIYQILLNREAPLVEFTLNIPTDATCVEVDQAIAYLSKQKTLKKLTLVTPGEYRLPLSLFSLDQLTYLHLSLCDLVRVPEDFGGFLCLKTLVMEDVFASKSRLLLLLSRCPSLESLTVNTDAIVDDDNSTLTMLFQSFFMVENMSVYLSAIECFTEGGVPHVLPAPLINLKYVCINSMDFRRMQGLPFLLFLLRSSPKLEKFKLQILELPVNVDGESESSFSFTHDDDDFPEIWLENLQVFEVYYLYNKKPDIEFIQFIMVRSPMLNKLKIILWEELSLEEELEISHIVLGSARASPLLEITMKKEA
ncbi:F-box/FBD/LRR-repeat protein At1g13570-like [Bidens hawaiensis]|uniref:F-box/FBD/LRR-repeat protein At1g13570-like n=1 Tax=Bidens hawaiensis TaxID=980011 RepID=UPI00404B45C6